MKRSGHHGRGFTLIELMLVVGIIGMLCAMAIPNVQAYGWRAKRTERAIAMRNIGQAMTDYILAHEGLTNSGVTQGFLAAMVISSSEENIGTMWCLSAVFFGSSSASSGSRWIESI